MGAMRVSVVSLGLAAAAVAIAAASCGGGGSQDGDQTPSITDPGAAPTATPLAGAVKYEIRGGSVTIPNSSTTPAVAGTPGPSGRVYTVAPGDSCVAIAETLGVALEALLDANPQINDGCTNLHGGDQLDVPASESPPAAPGATATARPTRSAGAGSTYTVQAGDTCVDIAASFGVDVDELIALNGLDARCSLDIDQVLQIP